MYADVEVLLLFMVSFDSLYFSWDQRSGFTLVCKRHTSLPDARDLDRATSHAQKRVRELHFHEFAIQSLYLKSAFNVG